ncbi:MAG: diaminopimelate epimerase [Candidatus Omnitrophica bacterium]|nr:diaminopimelate epimerase [Candidatus Omnitrophota bacterium]
MKVFKKYNINFVKAEASGNDFIIINARDKRIRNRRIDYKKVAADLCRRHYSVGADGILVLEPSKKADFKMRIINSDGSEASMCGNGMRCSALYASRSGWGDELAVETGAGILYVTVKDGLIKVKMTTPADICPEVTLKIGRKMFKVGYVNTGVPHAVVPVKNIDTYPVRKMGRVIRNHSYFAPRGTNVDFVEKKDRKILIRTYERGVEDETLSCGTGNVAAAVMMGVWGEASSPVAMTTKSGEITKVYFGIKDGKVKEAYLEGRANIIFEGGV